MTLSELSASRNWLDLISITELHTLNCYNYASYLSNRLVEELKSESLTPSVKLRYIVITIIRSPLI